MAFMVPLMKNHYDIYNTRSSLPDHDSGYLIGASNNNINGGRRRSGSNIENNKQTMAASAAGGSTVVLNGIVLMNGRTKSKPKIILTSQGTSKKHNHQSQPIQMQKCKSSVQQQQQQRRSPTKNSPSPTYTSTQSMNTRSFPHVRRTVRNPITNRVYSYSVSIPEYVAEEDEEELAALKLEELGQQGESPLDQVMIFSTSAPAGTGSIGNGIIDIVDEDDFIRCTGARLPTSIRRHSKLNSNSNRNDSLTSSLTHLSSLPNSPMNINDKNENVESSSNESTNTTSPSSQFARCNSSNSREYMELLQKFILHLKMLKLKRIFNTKNTKECRRSRSSTLDDSINL